MMLYISYIQFDVHYLFEERFMRNTDEPPKCINRGIWVGTNRDLCS